MNDEYQAGDETADAAPLTLEAGAPLGVALRARRAELKLSLELVADSIRIPARVLAAIEDERLDALPSRPFALGHTRAYAQHLGLDERLAVDRMRTLYDEPVTRLEAPVGVAFDDKPRRSPLFLIGGVVLVVAVVGWNVLQRVRLIHAPGTQGLAEIPVSWSATDEAPMRLEAARPAPADQTTPAPYITPGLEEVLTPILASAAAAPIDAGGPIGAAFNPRGPVHGEPGLSSAVILQATRPASIIVRAQGGTILFARQFAAGEAWRAPAAGALSVEVSDPGAFDVFLNGERAMRLEQPTTALASLNGRAEALAHQAAADTDRREREAEAQAQARLRAVEAAPPAPSEAIADPTAPDAGSLPVPAVQPAPLTQQ